MLLTGFQSYGARAINPAEEIVKRLDGWTIGGERVSGRILPVDFRGLEPAIRQAISETTPLAVICLGLWPGAPTIRLERVAVNVADFEIADNVGEITKEPLNAGGEVLLDGKSVQDVPPWYRQLGMVFQQYANFPHIDVAANIAYGLRRRGASRDDIEARVDELLRLVGLKVSSDDG